MARSGSIHRCRRQRVASGHCSQSEEFLEAADAYGVMVDQPSGDGEGHWVDGGSPPSADDITLKEEVHRDMVIYDRNHPSVLDWETDNGGVNWPLVGVLKSIDGYWDSLVSANSPVVNPTAANRKSGLGVAYPSLTAPNVRYEGSRGYDGSTSPPSAYAYLDLCDGAGCETGQKHAYPENPAFGAEYWTNKGDGRGLTYDYELAFVGPVMNPWAQARAANTFGMSHWYYADTPGETCTWLEYDNFDYPPTGHSLSICRTTFARWSHQWWTRTGFQDFSITSIRPIGCLTQSSRLYTLRITGIAHTNTYNTWEK